MCPVTGLILGKLEFIQWWDHVLLIRTWLIICEYLLKCSHREGRRGWGATAVHRPPWLRGQKQVKCFRASTNHKMWPLTPSSSLLTVQLCLCLQSASLHLCMSHTHNIYCRRRSVYSAVFLQWWWNIQILYWSNWSIYTVSIIRKIKLQHNCFYFNYNIFRGRFCPTISALNLFRNKII